MTFAPYPPLQSLRIGRALRAPSNGLEKQSALVEVKSGRRSGVLKSA